LLGIVYVISAN